VTAPQPELRGLILDYGGVLTTNVFASWKAFCVAEGLPPSTVKELFREEPRASQLVRAMETGTIDEDEFGQRFGELLGIEDRSHLLDRIFGATGPDEAMIAAVRRARAQGVRTGLISNSMGSGIYDRAAIGELFDGVVISGDVGMHKPQPEIYLLGAERAGVPPENCVFVDDLRENCAGAEAVGMTAVLHRGAETTLPRVEELLGVKLSPTDAARAEADQGSVLRRELD
jgi:putative hydrolase of the HAD superfamily